MKVRIYYMLHNICWFALLSMAFGDPDHSRLFRIKQQIEKRI